MRVILAAVFLLVLSSLGFAAAAPSFNKMSADEIQQYFAGKSVMHYDRQYGTAIAYFRSNGTLYIYGAGVPVVQKSKWTVVTEPGKAILCLAEAGRNLSRAIGARLQVRVCVEARDFVRKAIDVQQGDVLGISKRSKPGYPIDGKKTNFAKLRATKP
jgi:hypothetical protein